MSTLCVSSLSPTSSLRLCLCVSVPGVSRLHTVCLFCLFCPHFVSLFLCVSVCGAGCPLSLPRLISVSMSVSVCASLSVGTESDRLCDCHNQSHMCRSVLQCVALCRSVLHCVAMCDCHTPLGQETTTHCNTLQHTATHCNTLQHTATHCDTLQRTATHCDTLQRTATPRSLYWLHLDAFPTPIPLCLSLCLSMGQESVCLSVGLCV